MSELPRIRAHSQPDGGCYVKKCRDEVYNEVAREIDQFTQYYHMERNATSHLRVGGWLEWSITTTENRQHRERLICARVGERNNCSPFSIHCYGATRCVSSKPAFDGVI